MSSTVTREQFASAVSSAISSIHHLYREVGRLMSGLREHLAEGPESLIYVSGSFTKVRKDQTLLIIRNEYVALFGPKSDGDQEDEDEDEGEFEEEGDEPEDEPIRVSRKRKPAMVSADQPLLAVRIVMFDPQRREVHEPQIQFAVMNEWTVGKEPWKPERKFVLQRYMLRRVPRVLGTSADSPKKARIKTKAAVKSIVGAKKIGERQLGCCLPEGVVTVPLYSLDTAEELERLSQRMKAMVKKAMKEE